MLPYSLPVESRKALQHFGCQENFFQGSAVMTWMGFAITFVARPFGGIVLGLLGDIFGRKAQPGIGMDEVTSKYCIPFSVSFHKAARSDAHELRWKIRSSFELSQQLLTCHAACKGNQLRTKSNQAFSAGNTKWAGGPEKL